MDPEHVDLLHLMGNRFELYRRIGEQVLRKNTSGTTGELSIEDIAAVGVVAFADFVDVNLTGRQVLTSLLQEPITPDLILEKGQIIASLHKEAAK